MRSMLSAALMLCLFGCEQETSSSRQTVDLKYKNTSDLPMDQADKAVGSFISSCPAVAASLSDISDIRLNNGNEINAIDRLQGWTKKYELTFKVGDIPQHRELIEAMAMGHTCYYDFGGGNRPGYVAAKTPCAQICGQQEVKFVPLEPMRFLDDPSSQGYQNRLAKMEKSFRALIAQYEPGAMRGDYQDQRNLAYTYGRESFAPDDRITACAWRSVILYSQKKADASDKSNLNFDCGYLKREQVDEAIARAEKIYSAIGK